MGKAPKYLSLAGALILGAKAACHVSKDDTSEFETTVTPDRVAQFSKPAHQTAYAELSQEEEAIKSYVERCLTQQGENTLDFIENCKNVEEAATGRLNGTIKDLQKEGSLGILKPFENCPKFHWTNEEDRSTEAMLAAPAPHSHFDFENWDCVMGLYVYTDESSTIACKLNTVCRDGSGEKAYLSGFRQEDCETKAFNATDALYQFDQALDEKYTEAVK